MGEGLYVLLLLKHASESAQEAGFAAACYRKKHQVDSRIA